MLAKHRPAALIAFLLFLAALLALAPAAQAEPQRHALKNGLTVITSENHEAPVVAFQVWVRAGSAYERPGEYGITHLIEHMIFKGHGGRTQGDMARRIEALGGEVNAYTTLDHTNYYVVAYSAKAVEALELLGRAVVSPAFDPKELAREKEVVVEEIRMNQNNPQRRLGWEVMKQAFGDHPYGRPVIGSIESVRAITRQTIVDYVARLYRAPNMVLVCVGDFKTAELLPRLEKVFGSLNPEPAPAFHLPPVKVPAGPRLKVMREKVRQATINITWRIPGLPDPQVYPLDVAASVAGDGETSRLYSRLKEGQGLVDDVSAGAYTPEGVGLFEVEASLAPEGVEKAWPALIAQTLTLASDPPHPAELSRARTQLAAGFVRSRQTMQGQARTLGYFEMFRGGYQNLAEYLARFQAVGAGAVAETARAHFRPGDLSVVIQLPEGAPAPDLAALQAQAAKLYAAAVPPPAPAEPQPVKYDLANGLTLIVKPQDAVPLVNYVLVAPGGGLWDTPATAGLGALWSEMLTRGTAKLDYQALTTRLEDMAGSLSGFSARTAAGITGSFLSNDWQEGLDLLAQAWLTPTFPADQLAKAKEQQAAALRSQLDSPVARAFIAFRRLMFGDHSYGLNPLGSPESLAALTRELVAQRHSKLMGPGGLVLAVVGDVDPEAVRARVESLFGKADGHAAKPPAGDPPPLDKARAENQADPQARQTQIVLGFITPGALNPARHALTLAEAVLGGQGGRLFTDLRDKRSLAYAVQPFFVDSWHAGIFGVYMAVGPGKDKAALAGIAEHLQKLGNQPLPAAELERAKGYVLGSKAIGQQSYSSQAMTMALDQLMGLGYLYYRQEDKDIAAVSAADVQAVARRLLAPEHQVLYTSGP